MERARQAVSVETGFASNAWVSLASFTVDTANLLPECDNQPLASCYNPFAGLWPPDPRQR